MDKPPAVDTPIERVVWDLTYACPLRCLHCFTESGRRAAGTLDQDDALRVVDVILASTARRVSIGGGEPFLAQWWQLATSRLTAAGLPVTLFTGGWTVTADLAARASRAVTGVAVSLDGATAPSHDYIRGRTGSFERALGALELLSRAKGDRRADGDRGFRLGLEYTVTQRGWSETEQFVTEMTTRFPEVDYINFGAVIPEGLAQERDFVAEQLLSDDQLAALSESESRLAGLALSEAEIRVVDARTFLPGGPAGGAGDRIAHIEADGQLRASTNFEAKVGSVLSEPLDQLWQRAIEWRNLPAVWTLRNSIQSLDDWAEVTRVLDRRYGSDQDKSRIARRSSLRRKSVPARSDAPP